MAILIQGGSGSTRFSQDSGLYAGGSADYAYCTRFKISTSTIASDIIIFRPNSTQRGEHYVSTGGQLNASLITSDSNETAVVSPSIVANQEYTIFSVRSGGTIRHYLDGVEVFSAPSTGNLTPTGSVAEIRGSYEEGEDIEIIEVAIWTDQVPTNLEIANYPQTAITDFSNQPDLRFYPSGENVPTATITDVVGGLDLIKRRGADSILTPAEVQSVGSDIVITHINGDAVTDSDKIAIGYRQDKTALISVQGTYVDTAPDNIQMKIGASSYVNGANFTAADGTFSCDVTLGAGLGVSYRSLGGATETTMPNFAVGRMFIIDGQSNAGGVIQSPPASYVDGATLVEIESDTSEVVFNPVPDSDYHLAHGLALLSRFTGEPIIFINVAIGGTGITTHLRGGSSYITAMSELTNAGIIGNGAWKTSIWLQGENDTGVGNNELYESNLKTLYNEVMVEDYGVTEMYAIPIRHTGSIKNVQEGTIAAINNTKGIKLGCDIQDIQLGDDGLHINSPFEAEIIGARLSQTFISEINPQGENKNVTLTVTGIPDGVYNVAIFDAFTGHRKFEGEKEFSSETANFTIQCSTGDILKGYVDDGSTLNPVGTRVLLEVL